MKILHAFGWTLALLLGGSLPVVGQDAPANPVTPPATTTTADAGAAQAAAIGVGAKAPAGAEVIIDGGNDDGRGITDSPQGLKLQAEGHDVRYRNAWIKELDLAEPDTDFKE